MGFHLPNSTSDLNQKRKNSDRGEQKPRSVTPSFCGLREPRESQVLQYDDVFAPRMDMLHVSSTLPITDEMPGCRRRTRTTRNVQRVTAARTIYLLASLTQGRL